MRFMVIVKADKNSEAGIMPSREILTAMGKFNEQLVKAGVDTELHVWEGLFHGFFYNVDVPESKDAFNVMVKFFDRHLGQE